MVQFFERVSLNSGETAAIVLTRYGIDSSRWPEVQRFQQNAHVPAGAGLNVGPPQVNFLCVPIDNFMMVVNYRVVSDTVNGLRPANLAWTAAERLAYVKACAHGVEIQIERDGNACVGLRWVQTAKKRNATPFHGLVSPPEFVDTGITGFPFYNGHNDPNSADDLEFDDTPCGPAPSKFGMGLDFHATASLVAWTPPRVTIVEGYTYRFQIAPAGALWIIKPREATDAEYAEQVRILGAGIGGLHQDSGKSLQYRKPPQLGGINP
jgi:hypothetical protein